MERRGYVKAGAWTPEATVEHPEAVRQLHSEFLRAGANVMQTFTFYASKDKLENRSHSAGQYEAINLRAYWQGMWPAKEMLWWRGTSHRCRII